MQPEGHHLAQFNVGRLRWPADDPRSADFMAGVEAVNNVGERSPGFVWMMAGSSEPSLGDTHAGDAPDLRMITNLTVWEDAKSLEHFVWNTVHRQFYERRADWFEALEDRHLVFWWVAKGDRPSLEDAWRRLRLLQDQGPTPAAFDWVQLQGAQMWRGRRCDRGAA